MNQRIVAYQIGEELLFSNSRIYLSSCIEHEINESNVKVEVVYHHFLEFIEE